MTGELVALLGGQDIGRVRRDPQGGISLTSHPILSHEPRSLPSKRSLESAIRQLANPRRQHDLGTFRSLTQAKFEFRVRILIDAQLA
jgi:hypothetical protein